jgi:hypothetical protein
MATSPSKAKGAASVKCYDSLEADGDAFDAIPAAREVKAAAPVAEAGQAAGPDGVPSGPEERVPGATLSCARMAPM